MELKHIQSIEEPRNVEAICIDENNPHVPLAESYDKMKQRYEIMIEQEKTNDLQSIINSFVLSKYKRDGG